MVKSQTASGTRLLHHRLTPAVQRALQSLLLCLCCSAPNLSKARPKRGYRPLNKSLDAFLMKALAMDGTDGPTNREYLKQGKFIVKASVETVKNIQNLDVKVAGFHSESCQKSALVTGHYESFKDLMSFIKESIYKRGRLNLLIDPPLIPLKIRLNFPMARILGSGDYPFIFDRGSFKGLIGSWKLTDFQGRCLYQLKSNWKGPDTGLSDLILVRFIEFVGLKGLEILFRKSGHVPNKQ